MAASFSVSNPANLVATRASNDGANNAMVQRWIVKGAVLDFTKTGQITINNAIGETNLTGSFEGVVSYEGNTTITLSPDAPHEASDLLFTDLQPIATPKLDTCRVEAEDNNEGGHPNVDLTLALTCLDTAPSRGNGLLNGVITLRSDTNFSFNGSCTDFNNSSPAPFTAVRMPNDGANNERTQRWIVNDIPVNFAQNLYFAVIAENLTGETAIRGSFEGVVSYDAGNTEYTATINVKNPNQKALLGNLVIGTKETIGNLVLSNGFEIVGLDFSTINTNLFGELQTTERPATTTMKFQIRILRTEIQHATRFFTELKSGTPALFQLTDDPLIGTRLFGWVRTFRITMDNNRKDFAIVTATIQGLV